MIRIDMQFEYFGGAQRSPEWYELRIARVTASRLGDWMAVSKAKTGAGKPLKARLDYEKELLYEKKFGVSFNNYISEAMNDGILFEQFALKQYQEITGNTVIECGAWYSDTFVASPDGVVAEMKPGNLESVKVGTFDGTAEVKVVRDNTFIEILTAGIPEKWNLQIQGQLLASGKKWCDFICINLNTKRVVIIRVMPDKEVQEYILEAIKEKFVTEELFDENSVNIHEFTEVAPEPKELEETNNFGF